MRATIRAAAASAADQLAEQAAMMTAWESGRASCSGWTSTPATPSRNGSLAAGSSTETAQRTL
jgi:hypothetical protein